MARGPAGWRIETDHVGPSEVTMSLTPRWWMRGLLAVLGFAIEATALLARLVWRASSR